MFFNKARFAILILFSLVFLGIIYFGNIFFIKNEILISFNKDLEEVTADLDHSMKKNYDNFLEIEQSCGTLINNVITYQNQEIKFQYTNQKIIYVKKVDSFFVVKEIDNQTYIKKYELIKEFFDTDFYSYYLVSSDGIIQYSNQEILSDKFYNVIEKHNLLDRDSLHTIFSKKENHAFDAEPFMGNYYNFYYNDEMDLFFIYETNNLVTINTMIIFNLIVFIVYSLLFLFVYLTYRHKKNLLLNKYDLKDYIFICINEKGKILASNNAFKRLFKDKTNFLSEFEFASETDLKIDNRIKIKYENKYRNTHFLDFMVFRKKREIYLIGDNNNLKYLDNNLDDFDVLTGLYNKKALSNDLNKFIHNKKEYENMICYLIDIKDFASLNKLYGENFCDEIIVQIVKNLKETKNKYIYRMENDRFLYLSLNENLKGNYVGNFRKMIAENLSELQVLNQKIFIKYNCAIYKYQSHLEDYGFDILEKLNLTLKEGKRKGIPICVFDENLNRKFNTEVEIVKVLEDTIKNNTFDFYYQPQYDIVNNKVFGMEALIRLSTPNYKNISPSIFIDIAEKKGLINKIGDLLIENVFKFVNAKLDSSLHVSINVSVIQLMNEGFVTRLLEEYKKYNFRKGQIVIEITETALISNFDEVIKKLNLIKSVGIHIYIDDFGSGYSSLLYLKDLPIDIIKLDKEFIKLIEIDDGGRLLVKKIIELAQGLNLEVIAEGVETEKQRDILKEFGCKYIQGYLISKPVVGSEIINFLNRKE